MIQTKTLLSLAVIGALIVGAIPSQSFADESGIEIEIEIKDGYSIVELKTNDFEDVFKIETTDKERILKEIMHRTNLSEDQITSVWEIEFDTDDSDESERHEIRPEECIVKEDKDIIVVEKECIYKVFDEIPKQECIIDAGDGLIWYERICIFEDEINIDRPMECIIEEDDHIVVLEEQCVLDKFGHIPHKECSKSADGFVFYDKACVMQNNKESTHEKPIEDDKTQKIIQELQEENRQLKQRVHELEKKIEELNQLLIEQLRVIYEWILNR